MKEETFEDIILTEEQEKLVQTLANNYLAAIKRDRENGVAEVYEEDPILPEDDEVVVIFIKKKLNE